MPLITTVTTDIGMQLLDQSFGSILNQVSTTFGISSTLLGILLVVLIIPMLMFMIWKFTGSFILSLLVATGTVIFLTAIGIVPVWMCIIFCVINGLWISLNIVHSDSGSTSIEKKMNNNVLCIFMTKDRQIIEKWSKRNKIKFEDRNYDLKHFANKIVMTKRDGEYIPTLYFVNGEIGDMTNQLVQDPKKLKTALDKLQVTTPVYSQKAVTEHGTWINTPTNPNYINFDSIQFPRGTKILAKLNDSHNQIVSIFSNNTNDSLINIDKMKSLELDIYNQGINVLKQVFEIAQQLQQSRVDELKSTSEQLKKRLGEIDTQNPLHNLLQDRLDVNNRSLGLVKKYNDRIDELLCQVELYTDSINEMCLQLPELLSHKAKDDMDKKLLEVNSRINTAQRIKDEYVKEGI